MKKLLCVCALLLTGCSCVGGVGEYFEETSEEAIVYINQGGVWVQYEAKHCYINHNVNSYKIVTKDGKVIITSADNVVVIYE